MTDPVLRDKILAAFFRGPDIAVEDIRQMLGDAWSEGLAAGKTAEYEFTENPYRDPPVLLRSVPQPQPGPYPADRPTRVNIKVHDVATGKTEKVGEFDYSQDEQGRGTFHGSVEHGSTGEVPLCHCQNTPEHIWQPDYDCPQEGPVG